MPLALDYTFVFGLLLQLLIVLVNCFLFGVVEKGRVFFSFSSLSYLGVSMEPEFTHNLVLWLMCTANMCCQIKSDVPI